MRRLLFVLLPLVAACDSGNEPPEPPGRGSFEVTVTADTTTTFGGDALAMVDGNALRSIGLFDVVAPTAMRRSVLLSTVESLPVETGSFEIGGWQSEAAFSASYNDYRTFTGAYADSGAVTISGVTGERINGSFWFVGTGRPFTEEGPRRYRVEGTFEAVVSQGP